MQTQVKPRIGRTFGLLAALFSMMSCGLSPTEVRYVDLVAEQRFTVDSRPLRAKEILAGDEIWVSATVPPGSRIQADVALHDDPKLTLAGFLDCGEGADPRLVGALTGSIRGDRDGEIGLEIDFGTADGWWTKEFALDGLSNTAAELEFRTDLPDGCVVRLREASIRHERQSAKAKGGRPTQILLISVDTLRRDGVGSFGGGVATPHLDRLARESERWTTAYAAAAWTKPSHASLLTGYHPETHRAIFVDQGMDAAVPTLAERFERAGLLTSALVFDCTWLSPRWGFGKGFDNYRVTQWRAGPQAREAAEWILDHRDRDFFFFLHTFEPHTDFATLPYEAPGVNRRTIADEFGVDGFGCRGGFCGANFVVALSRGEIPERPTDRVILRSTYDRGVAYLDESLGVLFDTLRGSGAWDDLMVVVTSDHGEEFSEHGGYEHHTMFDEILRVPLIIKWPHGERAGTVTAVPCSGIDIAPTLLAHAGLETADLPGDHLHSRDPEAPIFAGTLLQAVVSGGFKGIFGLGQPPKLFNLLEDPGELVDLAGQRPETLQILEELLARKNSEAEDLYQSFDPRGDSGRVELSPKERERLEAFGYLR